MSRSQFESLLTPEPTHIVRERVTICHMQLRDLVLCPDERGVVNYVQDQSVMERDISDPSSAQTPLVSLVFIPNTIASLPIPDSDERLLAAGGQGAELHLSIHSRRTSTGDPSDDPPSHGSRSLWQYDGVLSGSINNSVLLTSLNLTRSNESSAEPRVVVSNNDSTVKFFDVNVRGSSSVDGPSERIKEVGTLLLDVPVNHSSISPDGRTLLSVGDSPQVYLHGITGGARITFSPLAQLTLPALDPPPSSRHPFSDTVASFGTAFSPDGSKFAVASQDGMVAVWDVRSHKPMKVFTTERSRRDPPGGGAMGKSGSRPTGTADGWSHEDSWDWTTPRFGVPGWGVRSVKFSSGIGGKEVMTFTQHTSLLHVVDATTFEHEEIIPVPAIVTDFPRPLSLKSTSTATSTATAAPAPAPSPSPPLPSQPNDDVRIVAPTAHSGALEMVAAEAEGADGAVTRTSAHLDLAGTCFDPRGAWLYVASTAGIVEWGVRGGEKR
ncbi:hypothetical protein BJV74DRAFT_210575 [Russula compacta]|nr:hypothetical protein BJV74DRAFT_210575 [Russula compacta]